MGARIGANNSPSGKRAQTRDSITGKLMNSRIAFHGACPDGCFEAAAKATVIYGTAAGWVFRMGFQQPFGAEASGGAPLE
jgi:hypothetical protein